MKEYLAIYEITDTNEKISRIIQSESDKRAKKYARELGKEIKKTRKKDDPNFLASVELFDLRRLGNSLI